MLDPQDPKIIERYKALPQPLKDALWAEETIDHIFDVGKAQHLTVSQMGELADIVGLVILGILKPEDFGSEVQRKLNLTMERASAADAIVAAINEKIFTPLRQEILTVRTNANVTRTDAEKTPVAADKTPSVKEIVVPAIPQAASAKTFEENLDGHVSPKPSGSGQAAPLPIKQTAPSSYISPPYEGGVGEVKTIPQPVSIVAKPVSEPPRPSYAGRDSYREPIDGKAPTALMTQPPSVAPSQPISIFAKQIPSPTPQATQVGGQAKPISWADISPEKEKASSPPDAKSALERAMNDGISPEKTNAQKYQGKDPYREPIE